MSAPTSNKKNSRQVCQPAYQREVGTRLCTAATKPGQWRLEVCLKRNGRRGNLGGRPLDQETGCCYFSERGSGAAGVPVVAGASSGIQVIALRSYLNPFAVFNASLVEFMTRYHLLLSLVVAWTALNGTATSFSPIPRKPPTPTISASALPWRSIRTSMISPILLSFGS